MAGGVPDCVQSRLCAVYTVMAMCSLHKAVCLLILLPGIMRDPHTVLQQVSYICIGRLVLLRPAVRQMFTGCALIVTSKGRVVVACRTARRRVRTA